MNAEFRASSEAAAYAATIDRTTTDAHIPSLKIATTSEDTDALNFLGLAALRDGRTSAATDYWSRSTELRDWSAPLLLTRVGQTEGEVIIRRYERLHGGATPARGHGTHQLGSRLVSTERARTRVVHG